MGALLVYSIIVGVTLIPIYLIVRLLMSGLTCWRFNRGLILFGYLIALAMPFVIGWIHSIDFGDGAVLDIEVGLPSVMAVVADGEVDAVYPVKWWCAGVMALYFTGLLFFLLRELFIWNRMHSVISRSSHVTMPDGNVLCIHSDESIAPFSWYRYIVMSQKDYDEGGTTVIMHESMHIKARHWLDLLLAEAVALLVWYNPAGWLMRNELQAVHEYEADNGVVTGGANVRDYQLLLIQKAVGSRFPSIANSLDHSNLSKRIKMMLRKKSSPVQRWRAIAAVPALALTAVVFFNPGVAEALESLSTAKVTNYVAIMQEEPAAAAVAEPEQSPIALPSQSGEGDDGVYRSAETMPQYEGGEAALMKFIASNLKWIPGGKNGRLIMQFVVKKDGTVGDVKVLRPLSPEQDAEAERVVRMLKFTPGMVDGKPVDVWYTLPVSFRSKADAKPASPKKAPAAGESISGDDAYTAVETMPRYEGGEAALMKFIASNLKWIPGGKNGRLIMQFVVKKDGTVGDVKVLRPLSPEQDAEAERVVRMLKFTPGMMQGKPVNVWYTLPVSFRETKQSNSNTNSNTAPGTTTTTTTTTDGVSTTEVSYSPGN
ncbi:M56 family metallopeptidase [uncultured Muribaculum sp.]|uniref:M56 family metallopeptidase n=1 Tax=uncultured Muribaculum sp. TaxID=1918613 RepID=UPI002627237E|nr:M56 family metallopeptidase [uncultured Muribaculum sp.]